MGKLDVNQNTIDLISRNWATNWANEWLNPTHGFEKLKVNPSVKSIITDPNDGYLERATKEEEKKARGGFDQAMREAGMVP